MPGAVRLVAFVGDLHDARHADEVDVRRKAEGADDRRAGDHQDRQIVAIGDERLRDRAAAAQMPEPERIVAVDQHPRRTVGHSGPPRRLMVRGPEDRHFFAPHCKPNPRPLARGSGCGRPGSEGYRSEFGRLFGGQARDILLLRDDAAGSPIRRRMSAMSETQAMFGLLRQSADPKVADAIERLVDGRARPQARPHQRARLRGESTGSTRNATIAAFLHAAKIGLFDMSWNVLCPGCGGVLDSNTHAEDGAQRGPMPARSAPPTTSRRSTRWWR